MAPLTKAPTEGDILKFDLDKNYTREVVTLLEGTNYQIGSVLGQITSSGKYKLATATGSDGGQNAAGVLIEAVDASDGDRSGVIIRRGPAIVAKSALVFDASVDDAPKTEAKLTQLVAMGIVARETA
jgi:hypothetical protein